MFITIIVSTVNHIYTVNKVSVIIIQDRNLQVWPVRELSKHREAFLHQVC